MKIFSTRGTLTKTTPPGKKKAAAQAAAQCGIYIYQLPSPERGTPLPYALPPERGLLVDLVGFESLGLVPGAGDVVGIVEDLAAGPRARVSKTTRPRSAAEGMALEAVWQRRPVGGGLWRDHGRETLGSRTPTKTGAPCGRQTASKARAGTARPA